MKQTEFKVNDLILYKDEPMKITEVTRQGIRCDRQWLGFHSIGFTYDVKLLVPTEVHVTRDKKGWL
jgi:hypothetical protein